jgi:hypothetical protein
MFVCDVEKKVTHLAELRRSKREHTAASSQHHSMVRPCLNRLHPSVRPAFCGPQGDMGRGSAYVNSRRTLG